MAWPQTPLDVRVELLIDGSWTDVTKDVYAAEQISISRGRADEGARTDPGKCALTFNNGASKVVPGVFGRYSPRNPRSDLYGRIGRNTPLRVSVPGPTSYLELDGDPANYATTPDTAALDITGDLDLRWEGEANWNRLGAQILIGKWDAAGQKAYMLRLEDGYLVIHHSTDGTNGALLRWRLPALPRRAALRATLDVDNGSGGRTATFYWAPTLTAPWRQFGGGSVTGTGTTFASTAPLRIAPADLISATPLRYPVTGRVYRAEVRNGIDGLLVAAPDFTAQAPGTTAFSDGVGLPWTLAGQAAISNRRTRFVGEVSAWPARWDVSGKDVRVPVEAAGVLRRYGQGTKALDSTLRRRIPSGNPLAYWPMEDGAEATQAASAVSGGRPLRVSGLSFGGSDYPAGSSPLPTLGQSASLEGRVPGATAGGWHVEMVYKLPTLPSVEQTMLSLTLNPGTGGVAQVLCRVSAAGIRVQALDGDGTVLAFFVFSDADAIGDFAGVWNRLQIYSATSGSNAYLNCSWRDVVANTWWNARTTWVGTPGTLTGIKGSWGSDFQGMAIGHLAAWDIGGTTAPAAGVTVYNDADDGFRQEPAGVRLTRLASEESFPLTVYGAVNSQEPMGPQRVETLLALLEEAADVEGGILYERRDRLGLAYRDRASLYSQAPALRLDYTVDGHVAPPLEPVDDDQAVRNDVTVTRDGGASARVTLDTGPLSTQAPPNGVGVYDESVTLNLYDDDQPAQHAAWRLHMGTVDEARYPVVNVDLAAAPALVDAVTALDSGDRIQIANPPAWLPPGPIDLIVQGYTEVIGHPNDWDVQLTCTPATPWTVAATAVYEDFEDSTYAVTITSGGNAPWDRSQTRYNTGTWSLQSGAIANAQTSDAIVTVPDGATELTFWYRVSSEPAGPGFEGDRLVVLVDGTQVLRAQGEVGWTRTTIDVTGRTAVTFRYAKDNSSSAGEDAAWIDDLLFKGPAPMRAATDGSQLAAGAGTSDTTLSVAVTTGPLWITDAAYPADFPFDVTVGGERMRVTSITGSTSPQAFTVVRSVNGVSKAQTAGTPVQLADPSFVAL
ncbi:hypothetical protein ACH4JS_34765 [Streptomyces sp. NPDC017638]|uniref:hypothetical protein n=1 Tax=unclassified Streptomyces TaxID=2593676 RepID=UPI002965F765|nr:hypothetical protein [Streptomyces sp. SCL15-4]